MAQSKTVATEAIAQSISVRDSVADSAKDLPNDRSVEIGPPRETSVSQNDIVAEKMVSGKDGTVTRTPMQYGNTSANNVASTKYVDDMSSGIKSAADQNDALPQGIKSASAVEIGDPDKRETNISQNTMIGEQPATIQPADQMSQIEINGIIIPENGSTLQKVSAEHRTKDNNSTLQQMNTFGVVATEVLPE